MTSVARIMAFDIVEEAQDGDRPRAIETNDGALRIPLSDFDVNDMRRHVADIGATYSNADGLATVRRSGSRLPGIWEIVFRPWSTVEPTVTGYTVHAWKHSGRMKVDHFDEASSAYLRAKRLRSESDVRRARVIEDRMRSAETTNIHEAKASIPDDRVLYDSAHDE